MFGFLADLLLVGSLGFWLFIAVFCVLVAILAETEKVGWASIVLVLSVWCLCAFNGVSILHEVANNPVEVALMVAGYALSGVLWSMVKWWRFVITRLEEYRTFKERFLAQRNITDTKSVPSDLRNDFNHALETWNGHGYGSEKNHEPPKPGKHKTRIMSWMMYWPLSLIWTMFDDPVRRLFNSIFTHMVATYEGIAKKVFKEVDKDFA